MKPIFQLHHVSEIFLGNLNFWLSERNKQKFLRNLWRKHRIHLRKLVIEKNWYLLGKSSNLFVRTWFLGGELPEPSKFSVCRIPKRKEQQGMGGATLV
jgi:hypothetical protein